MNSLLFAIPFLTFGFTVHIDPLRANYRAIAADVVSKIVIGARWVLFARGPSTGPSPASPCPRS